MSLSFVQSKFLRTVLTFSLALQPLVATAGVDDPIDYIRLKIEADAIKKRPAKLRKFFADRRWGSLVVIGNVPKRYLTLSNDYKGSELAKIRIEDGVIQSIKKINVSDAEELKKKSDRKIARALKKQEYDKDLFVQNMKTNPRVILLRKSEYSSAEHWDVVYPGLIDLHNHTKQNNLAVWSEAKGQFQNRFEWRDWKRYQAAVSLNMNPWITYGKPVTCAAFRWSEVQAMINGTIYLQGPSSCVNNFAIHRVEDRSAYKYKTKQAVRAQVQAPTDLINPADMVFVWNFVRPRMTSLALSAKTKLGKNLEKLVGTKELELKSMEHLWSLEKKVEILDQVLFAGVTYEQAFKSLVHQYCPSIKAQINDVNGVEEMAIFKNKALLIEKCTEIPEDAKKFIRYANWQHKNIAKRKVYFQSPNHAALIIHLSEGRAQDDLYNLIEFPMVKLFGLNRPNVNFVHTVAADMKTLEHMAEKEMGIIWSPFSNLLLYGETLDVVSAMKAGVKLAIGSDWNPTGSRGVLQELKIAKAWVKEMAGNREIKKKLEKLFHGKALDKVISDQVLFEMVTENPARMINHFEKGPRDDEHGIGTLQKDAMGSLIVVKNNKKRNVYSNLIAAQEKDINLVVVDGKIQYGEQKYLKQYNSLWNKGDENKNYEVLPNYMPSLDKYATDPKVPTDFANLIFPKAMIKSIKEKTISRTSNFLRRVELASLGLESIRQLTAQQRNALEQRVAVAAEESYLKHGLLVTLANIANSEKHPNLNKCGFTKGFVHQKSRDRDLLAFGYNTALIAGNDKLKKSVHAREIIEKMNLDRVSSITKLMAINMLSQGRNKRGIKNGKLADATPRFSPLYACNDEAHQTRIQDFIEYVIPSMVANKHKFDRKSLRVSEGHDAIARPDKLARKYKLLPPLEEK